MKGGRQGEFHAAGPSKTFVSSRTRRGNNSIEDETITFAAFLSDFDPSLILVMTYSATNSVSYLKILKIEKRGGQEERCYSVVEESDMEKLKSAVKMEMIKNNVQSKVPLQSDNYQVEIDEEKQ